MSEAPADLELVAEKVSDTRHTITLSARGERVYVDKLDVSSATARARFVEAATARCPGIEPDRIEAELLKITPAPTASTTSPACDEPREVDGRRVVRPELFHTPEVSGITVAVRLDVGGKLVPRWRTYQRWRDGRREAIDPPDRITMPDGSTLYVHPDPGEPPGSGSPGWTVESRRAWLDGAPAPDPADVFRRVCERIAYFLDFPPENAAGTAATVALWSLLTYTFPAWDEVPYLYAGGPLGSGKTRLLDVIGRIAFRPLSTSNLTGPALFRTLHACGGTVFYDEAERLRQGTPDVQELLSVFQAGYKRGGCATRLEPVGDSGFRPVRFDVFGPKALACIAGLPPPLASRCVRVGMFRSAGNSPKPRRRLDADPSVWQAIRDDLHVLALEYGPTWVELSRRQEVVPSTINGRNFELWQPLLAMAGWLQDHGAGQLLELVQCHAVGAVASDRDDAVPETDEVLLDLLAEAVREFRWPTPGELLRAARERDEVAFKLWQPATVTRRLKSYGISTPKKTNGERRYRDVTPESLRRVSERYGIDLGFPEDRPVPGNRP
jgi:hypothetical protein